MEREGRKKKREERGRRGGGGERGKEGQEGRGQRAGGRRASVLTSGKCDWTNQDGNVRIRKEECLRQQAGCLYSFYEKGQREEEVCFKKKKTESRTQKTDRRGGGAPIYILAAFDGSASGEQRHDDP
jgi:hypothetical protein